MAYLGNSPGVASQRVESAFTATSSQTVFTPSSGYTLGYCDVYQNGVKLVNGDDYTAADGATITLATGAATGDSIVIVASFPRGLSDGYLKSEADAKYLTIANPSYTGTLTGGTGVVNLGSGQFYKDSSGNVGVGTTVPVTKFAIENTERLEFAGASGFMYSQALNAARNATVEQRAYGSALSWWTGAAGGQLERMRIDSSGKVGIGLGGAAANAGVTVNHYIGTATNSSTVNSALGIGPGGVTNPILGFRWTYSASTGISGNLYSMQIVNDTANANAFEMYTTGASPLVFGTSSTERVRIDGSGRLQFNTTSVKYSSLFTLVKGGNAYNITSSVSGTNSQGHMVFENNNADAVGTIFTAGSSTSYNTTSDYRLKENVTPMVGALNTVSRLKPVTYTWKSTGESSQGFIAHELQEVCPDCVTGEKDAVDDEGNPVYQGIDVSFLVGTLTAAIQEQQAIIEQLQADVATLKGTP
jgi:hypothetical protein